MITPPPTALLPLAAGALVRAEATESFDAAGAADAMVGTATSDRAVRAAVAIFETLIDTLPFEISNLKLAFAITLQRTQAKKVSRNDADTRFSAEFSPFVDKH